MMDADAYRRKKKLDERYLLLRSWYGKTVADVEMAAHSPQPVKIGEVLEHVSSTFVNAESGFFAEITNRWSRIAGHPFAEMAVPESFSEGVLMLKVRHSAFIRELEPSLDLVLGNVQKALPQCRCREVRLCCAAYRFSKRFKNS